MESRLCPKCGAYWRCSCVLEELAFPLDRRCDHDWVEAVGVALEDDLLPERARVIICRLCGLYAVEERV